MTSDSKALRRELRQAGLTTGAIDALWPEWWTEAAETSVSAAAELRYTIARRLGLSPRSLFDGAPRFVWRDRAKYKNLGTASRDEIGILTSFGVAVAHSVLVAAPPARDVNLSAENLRESILSTAPAVTFGDLLALCWGLGLPVVQLRLFPLGYKRMQAMTVEVDGRFAILLGRETRFAAQAAYIVSHEIGHIALRHTSGLAALLDVENPLEMVRADSDQEELAADRFALELLLGDPDVRVEANLENFTATQLAHAALAASESERIDPGVLALCLAHATGRWRQGYGSLKILPPGELDVGSIVNDVAARQLDWSTLSPENVDYLRKVMGHAVAA